MTANFRPCRWQRVSISRRCPICDHADWCLVSEDGTAAICPRIESERQIGEAGWLHRLNYPADWTPSLRCIVLPPQHKILSADVATMSRRFQAKAQQLGKLNGLAEDLGLTAESLDRFGVGWSFLESCSTWPMFDAAGRFVGITRRFADGSKRIMRGHRAGLYLPGDLPVKMSGPGLLVTEGASDAVAGLDLGLWTVGRFSCRHSAKLLVELITLRRPGQIVIVADVDSHGAGRRGAESLASALLPYVPCLKVIEPPAPHTDLRAWRQAGATFKDLHRLIESTPARRLAVKVRHA